MNLWSERRCRRSRRGLGERGMRSQVYCAPPRARSARRASARDGIRASVYCSRRAEEDFSAGGDLPRCLAVAAIALLELNRRFGRLVFFFFVNSRMGHPRAPRAAPSLRPVRDKVEGLRMEERRKWTEP